MKLESLVSFVVVVIGCVSTTTSIDAVRYVCKVSSFVATGRRSSSLHPAAKRALSLLPFSISSNNNSNKPSAIVRGISMADSSSVDVDERQLSVGNRIEETLDPCIVLMKSLVSKHSASWPTATTGGIYSLAQGVVYWNPPPSVYSAIATAITAATTADAKDADDCLHAYGPAEGLPSLLDAIDMKLRRENGVGKDRCRVMVTSGANQAYMNCVLTLLSDDDACCVVFEPYYFNHVMALQMTLGNDGVLIAPITHDGYPNVDWLRSHIQRQPHERKIQMVTVVNPGNPTGVTIPQHVLDSLVRLCKDHGIWCVMDNTYEHFILPTNTPPLSCYHEEHVIHIFSFSKGYAMAGFRVGYVVLNTGAGDRAKHAYRQMLKVQDTIPICTSRLSQIAALGALSVGREWVSERVATLDIGRAAIVRALSPLETILGGSGAMYIMGKLPDGLNDIDVADMLVERYGVAVIPCSFCGYPGWIRVCYSNLPPDQCCVAAERLERGIRELCENTHSLFCSMEP